MEHRHLALAAYIWQSKEKFLHTLASRSVSMLNECIGDLASTE
jgi:hypothetical protein